MPKKILIVDDEPNIVIPLEFLMKQSGFEVLIARNGRTALDLTLSGRPDLILLDIMLPDISGWEVCQTLRMDFDLLDMKIIMLTAKSREVDISKGEALGADLYVVKPFSTKDLMASVQKLLK